MEYTKSFNMFLPDYTDEIDVKQLNRNFKILDDQVKNGTQTWGDLMPEDEINSERDLFLTMVVVAGAASEEATVLDVSRSGDNHLKLKLIGAKRSGCIVDWGDGSLELIAPISLKTSDNIEHFYEVPGEYIVNFYARVPNPISIMPMGSYSSGPV